MISLEHHRQLGEEVEREGPGIEKSGPAAVAAFVSAQPALIFGRRLYAERTVLDWVEELRQLAPGFRAGRAEELVRGAPRGIGRRVVQDLLLRAAEDGPIRLLTAGAFAAFIGAEADSCDPRRKVKTGTAHDRITALAEAADRVVRSLIAYPRILRWTEAEKRSNQRLLQEVAAHILREDRPESPARSRRPELDDDAPKKPPSAPTVEQITFRVEVAQSTPETMHRAIERTRERDQLLADRRGANKGVTSTATPS